MDENTDFYAKAASELASIDAQIAALEKRRTVLRQFVELGRQLFADAKRQTASNLTGTLFGSAASQPSTKFGLPSTATREGSLKARILTLSRRAIEERGPTHTRDLVAYIESHGVEVTGADKNTTVSVVLSRSDGFKSDRATGWSLVQKETPQDAPTSAGSGAA